MNEGSTRSSPQPRPRFRFAPSPNGELHLGHAYSALRTWELAARVGGEVLLRIEDIDTGRSRDAYIERIFEDLSWLGLTWPEPVRRQSEHFADYRAATEKLVSKNLLYPCTATRKQIAAAIADQPDWPCDPDGAPLYPGLARVAGGKPADAIAAERTATTGAALRIDMDRAISKVVATGSPPLTYFSLDENGVQSEQAVNPAEWGDAVIVRKDTPTSYHLSVVVDDALQGITHVTRGQDLKAATSLHVLLQRLLGLSTPVYNHHRLITDKSGRKLAKSLGDTSLHSLRNIGWTPADVCSAVGITAPECG